MLTQNIKTATLQYHQETEKILMGKLKNMRLVKDYSEILKLFYGYFAGLETQINQYIDATHLADYSERRKTEILANDIEALGNSLPTKAAGQQLPVIKTALQAFGALYVIEGSTLGGQIISKMVQQHLDLKGAGVSFFNGYGGETQQKWTRFQQTLNAIALNEAEENELITAANNTFAKFKDWMLTADKE